MSAEFQTSKGPMDTHGIFDFLLYVNYAHNRDIGMSAERGKWYPNADVLEARYQAEQAIVKARDVQQALRP